jgi:hypothetical protein
MKQMLLAAALLLASAAVFIEPAAAGTRDSGGHTGDPTWRTK